MHARVLRTPFGHADPALPRTQRLLRGRISESRFSTLEFIVVTLVRTRACELG